MKRNPGRTSPLVPDFAAAHPGYLLAALNEEYYLWNDQVSVVESALREVDETFTGALGSPSDIECPMCGQHYENHIADQFELAADKDELFTALQDGRAHLKGISDRIAVHRQKIQSIAAAIDRINGVMAIKRQDISLRDVVAAEGRNEAQRYLQERLSSLDSEYGAKSRLMESSEQQMKDVDRSSRKKQIRSFFASNLERFAVELDVRLPDRDKLSVQGLHIGRGSEGPRALAAYYYAFLHTARQFGSSTFCPIVIDAPNQQGQDPEHLRKIMEFLLSKSPSDAQVIIAAESATTSSSAEIKDISWKKDQVLREESYVAAFDHMRPYIRQSLL